MSDQVNIDGVPTEETFRIVHLSSDAGRSGYFAVRPISPKFCLWGATASEAAQKAERALALSEQRRA